MGQVRRYCEDARIVIAKLEPTGQDRLVGVVEFNAKRPSLSHSNREIQSLVVVTQIIEVTQCLSGKISDLGIVTLLLQFRDDHDG